MSFENLEVWKKSVHLSNNIYLELKKPKDYCFKDQITRSDQSVPSKIAADMERNSDKEKLTFYLMQKVPAQNFGLTYILE